MPGSERTPQRCRVLRGVLFDMDGTLVASDGVWDDALQELANARGGHLPPEFFVQCVGLATADAVALAHRTLGLSDEHLGANLDWLQNRVRARMCRQRPRWFPGARQLVNAVRAAGLWTGLVTSTDRFLVEVAMSAVDRRRFDVLVCGDDVATSKPSPEPYLRAAAALALAPAECAAVEDSLAGVTSALAAGCRVVAVGTEPAVAATVRTAVPRIAAIDLELLHSLQHGGPSPVQR